MAYVGEIPGMYYDKEKGKYFKIQANGAAPASSSYSSQDVKRRKLKDQRTQAIEDEKERQKGRIRRSIQGPVAGGLLGREYGTRSLDGPRIFANGLVSQGYFTESCGPPFDVIFTVHQRTDLGPSITELRTHYEDALVLTRINAHLYGHNERVPFLPVAVFQEHLGNPGQSTSMSIHEESQKFVATWMAESPNSGIAILSIGPNDEPVPGIRLGPGVSRGDEVDVHCSTAAPPHSSLLFAVGTTEGIMTIDKQNVNAHFLSRKLFPPEQGKDVFALEFLSEFPDVLMSGGRSNTLNITDLRVPQFGQQADVIKHPSSITHIKQLDLHRIIVAGLESSLCQYDLRFRKGPERTQSILQYPDYQNTATIRIGFDVDLESGVIAAAQEHDISHPPVQLFSLHGGHPLNSDVSHAGGHSKSDLPDIDNSEVIPCLRFAQDVSGRMKSLYVASDVVRKYGWGSRGEHKSLEGLARHRWALD